MGLVNSPLNNILIILWWQFIGGGSQSKGRQTTDLSKITDKDTLPCRALQFMPAPTSPWLVRKHFLLANKIILLARLIKRPIGTIQLQYVFICT